MKVFYKKVLPLVLSFNMALIATLPSLSMAETSQQVFNEAEYNRKKESLKKALYSVHGRKISVLIESLRTQIDEALGAIVSEVTADQSRQKIKDMPGKSSSELVSDYFNRHRDDFKNTQLGIILYKTVPKMLNQLNIEEKFVFKSYLADMIENQDYAKQYDRNAAGIGAGIGMVLGIIIYTTQIYSGKSVHAAPESLGGILITIVLGAVGMVIGDMFTPGMEAQRKAQQIQAQLKTELSSLRSDADSSMDELVRQKYYPETLN